MRIVAKLPIVMEFPTQHDNATPTVEDDEYLSSFIDNFREITGLKLKAKCLEPTTSSSYTSWILFLKKDRAYIAALEKFTADDNW